MHSDKNELLRCSFLSREKDTLVKKVLLTHDPDGRRIDSKTLLRAMENVMFYASISNISKSHLAAIAANNPYNNETVDIHDALGQTIYTISQEILYTFSGDQDMHTKTMLLLEMLGNFTWDAKVVIVLAAFAANYGEFWLIIQLYPSNPLALSVMMLKHLPNNLSAFEPQLKALSVLVKKMGDVTKCIIEFEGLQVQHKKLNDKTTLTTKSDIYLAAYWVIRSTLTCSSLVTDLITKTQEQVYMTSTTTAAWELSSLVCKMSGISGNLQNQIAAYHVQIEDKVQRKLSNLFKETHIDNQEVLSTLFCLKDDMPLKSSSTREKVGVSELRDKMVILLISKPGILPLEDLLFLIQQSQRLPHHDKLSKSYDIVWVPMSPSSTWSDSEVEVFNNLSDTLPWYSVHQPWSLSSAVVRYIKHEWNFVHEPLMVVLDSHGAVASPNAISMMLIWSSMAYPFSISREQQLWDEANWSLKLVIDEVDPLVSMKVEEGRIICLYGGSDLDWIREFTSKIKEIVSTGVPLELLYVGKRKPGKSMSYALAAIAQENLSGNLSSHNMNLFWLRLESIQRSRLQIGMFTGTDRILKEVVSLMSHDDNGWALLGEGLSPDTVHYDGSELMRHLNLFPLWAQNVGRVGFLNAMRSAFETSPTTRHCGQCNLLPYTEGTTDGPVVCEECKSLMEKYVLYQCQGSQQRLH